MHDEGPSLDRATASIPRLAPQPASVLCTVSVRSFGFRCGGCGFAGRCGEPFFRQGKKRENEAESLLRSAPRATSPVILEAPPGFELGMEVLQIS